MVLATVVPDVTTVVVVVDPAVVVGGFELVVGLAEGIDEDEEAGDDDDDEDDTTELEVLVEPTVEDVPVLEVASVVPGEPLEAGLEDADDDVGGTELVTDVVLDPAGGADETYVDDTDEDATVEGTEVDRLREEEDTVPAEVLEA